MDLFGTLYTLINIFLRSIIIYLIYKKISDINLKRSKKFMFAVTIVIIFTGINLILSSLISEPYRSILIIMILSVILFFILDEKIENIFIDTAIAISITQFIYIISSIISSLVILIITKFTLNAGSWYKLIYFGALICALSQMAITFFLLKRKFQISFSQNKIIGRIGLVLSGFTLILWSLFQNKNILSCASVNLVVGAVLFAGIIAFWIKRETGVLLSSNFQKSELAERENEIRELKQEHQYLSSRVHDDNQRLLAYRDAVRVIAEKSRDENLKKEAMQMIKEFDENKEEICAGIKEGSDGIIMKTGFPVLDTIIFYMCGRAAKTGARFDFLIAGEAREITDHISIVKFEKLFANLAENAIIACRASKIKKISVKIEIGEYLILSVFDSGVYFSKEILEKLGKERVTAYAGQGGSGIGYMTIFEIMADTGGSLKIMEFTERSSIIEEGYKKRIDIMFNGKNYFKYERL